MRVFRGLLCGLSRGSLLQGSVISSFTTPARCASSASSAAACQKSAGVGRHDSKPQNMFSTSHGFFMLAASKEFSSALAFILSHALLCAIQGRSSLCLHATKSGSLFTMTPMA